MSLYPKIEGLYRRESEKPHRLLVGVWRNDTVRMLRTVPWVWTEKLDGTNIRIIWDGHRVTFGGRTERAQLPPHLLAYLTEEYSTTAFEEVLEDWFGDTPTVIYGEGYGAKIQKGGGLYIPDGVNFRAFDVRIGNHWLHTFEVRDLCYDLGVPTVPHEGTSTIADVENYVREGFPSSYGTAQAEGVVESPIAPVYTEHGTPLRVKIKTADYANVVEPE